MESRGPEDSKNVKTSQAYFFEGFISFFEDFSLTIKVHGDNDHDGHRLSQPDRQRLESHSLIECD